MQRTRSEEGFALALTLLVIVAIATLAGAAAVMTTTTARIAADYSRHDRLAQAAEEGLELARARVNSDASIYPDSGYRAIESNVPVFDGTGARVPGVTRSTYVGPIGITSGEYGINGSVVSVTKDVGGATVIRREHVVQESFARFAYFTDVEPSNISFGGGDQLFGPVHTNDYLKIYSSGASFFGPVTTAKTIQGRQYGDFRDTWEENTAKIAMPQFADLQKLRAQASAGGTNITGSTGGSYGEATTRLEFVAVDLNGDGDTRDPDEGFVKVYQNADATYVVGGISGSDMRDSETCGDWHSGTFYPASVHPDRGWPRGTPVTDDYVAALVSTRRACYLGGASELTGGFVAGSGGGQWLQWTGTVDARLRTLRGTEADYMFPVTRALNPAFKGVIYVDGNVAVSGVLRGRVTVAATGDIVIADDVTYATNPAAGTCDDILGLFAGGDVVVANTPMNAPWQPSRGNNYVSYDDTTDEFIHAFVLTLNVFTVQDFDSGSDRDERCQGDRIGRGCLYLTGGIIQKTRGAVGQSSWTGATGYEKRYSYDACGATQPPPYFPTTGHFVRGTHYDVDPNGFDVDQYFRLYSAG